MRNPLTANWLRRGFTRADQRTGGSLYNRWPAMRTPLAMIALIGLVGCVTSCTVSRSDVLKAEISGAPLTVKFVNNGDKPISILKPLDGSEWCWIMPYYRACPNRAKPCGAGLGSM
jgi:hypothetical protein